MRPRGSSPLARGRHADDQSESVALRIIPACAGPTETSRLTRHSRRGSSPLARGRLTHDCGCVVSGWIIPACAGPTNCRWVPRQRNGDHPRLRGADPQIRQGKAVMGGSSPLARGRPDGGRCGRADDGIIPAYAGPTGRTTHRTSWSGDHPRLRGADHRRTRRGRGRQGSSPLARGRHSPTVASTQRSRIIPACAGPTTA